MTKPRCIGRIARIRNGRLVARRKVWIDEDYIPFFVQSVRRFRRVLPIEVKAEIERMKQS